MPYDNELFIVAAVAVLFVAFWMQLDWLGSFGRDQLLAPLSHIGFPDYFVWFDKSTLALPRLLHALALAYVLSSIPQVRRIAESPFAAPLTLLGRHGLPVFATGSVRDMLVQAVKAKTGQDPLIDGVMFLAGLLILLALADILDRTGPKKRQPAATVAPRAAQGDLVVSPAE